MNGKIAVVIPYYQTQSGVLRHAVESVLNQQGVSDPLLIVVDDQSPVSAQTELASILPIYSQQIIIVEQQNGGAAAARNTGIEHVPSEISFVAFLDSDDEWTESHLKRATWALESGFDFYFSDFYQLNQTVTAFDRAGDIDVKRHPRIHPTDPIHAYQGSMFDQILKGNILGTSTTVYNRRRFPDLRYPLGFRHTGEEYIFWLHLALGSRKIAFSSVPECRYGAGVNIFADSGWGTDKYLTIQQDEMKWRKYVLSKFPVSPEQLNFVNNRICRSRENFARGFIHNLIHDGSVRWQTVSDQMKMDPLTFPSLFTIAMKVGLHMILSCIASTKVT